MTFYGHVWTNGTAWRIFIAPEHTLTWAVNMWMMFDCFVSFQRAYFSLLSSRMTDDGRKWFFPRIYLFIIPFFSCSVSFLVIWGILMVFRCRFRVFHRFYFNKVVLWGEFIFSPLNYQDFLSCLSCFRWKVFSVLIIYIGICFEDSLWLTIEDEYEKNVRQQLNVSTRLYSTEQRLGSNDCSLLHCTQ